MISNKALTEFKQIWANEFGENLSDEIAMEEGVNLLTMFEVIYRPIKLEWVRDYEEVRNKVVENQPISASCKSGAAR